MRTPAICAPSRGRGRPATPFLRERILDSASALFSEKQFDSVRIDEVAARAQVGKGSVYRNFKSKEQLYATVVIKSFVQLQQQVREALRDARSTRDQVTTIVTHTLRFFRDRREFSALMRDPRALPRAQERAFRKEREKLALMLAEVLARGMDSGSIRSDIAPRVAAESTLGMIRGLNRHGRELAPPDAAVRTIMAILFEGITRDTFDKPREIAAR